MASYNKVFLLGNLTRDPEVRYTPKGSAVADLGIAVNRQYTLDTGEKREEVTFVDVTFWGRTAEIAGEYLKKGRSVFIEGRLQLDTWDDKQSVKRCKCSGAGPAPVAPVAMNPRRRAGAVPAAVHVLLRHQRARLPLSRTTTRSRFSFAAPFP